MSGEPRPEMVAVSRTVSVGARGMEAVCVTRSVWICWLGFRSVAELSVCCEHQQEFEAQALSSCV